MNYNEIKTEIYKNMIRRMANGEHVNLESELDTMDRIIARLQEAEVR